MKKQNLLAFTITFFAYASLHSLRQGWSLSKARIKDIPELDAPKSFLGLVDTFYLLSYSFGMLTLGNVINKVQLKYFVSIGMILATIFYMFVVLYYVAFNSFNHVAVIIFMSLNGYFQCTGWPGLVGIMGNWFQKGKTGLILGIWAINANIGNIIAQLMCNILSEQLHASWIYNFVCTGIFNFMVAILIIFFLKQKPQKQQQLIQKQNNLGLSVENRQNQNNLQSILTTQQNGKNQENKQIKQQVDINDNENNDNVNLRTQQGVLTKKLEQQTLQSTSIKSEEKNNLNIFQAFCLPKVPSYVVGYAMLKGCIYGLLFWLPTYLNQKNLQSQSGYIAAMVDTGSFIGGLIIGHLGDKLQLRALFLSPLLFFSSVVMFCSAYFLTDIATEYYISMFLVGITIGGPYNIIGAVITIDLGRQSKKLGGSTAVISALIEGSAAIFAALSQLLLGFLSQDLTFYIFFCECLVAAIVLLPLFLDDLKIYKGRKVNKYLLKEQNN